MAKCFSFSDLLTSDVDPEKLSEEISAKALLPRAGAAPEKLSDPFIALGVTKVVVTDKDSVNCRREGTVMQYWSAVDRYEVQLDDDPLVLPRDLFLYSRNQFKIIEENDTDRVEDKEEKELRLFTICPQEVEQISIDYPEYEINLSNRTGREIQAQVDNILNEIGNRIGGGSDLDLLVIDAAGMPHIENTTFNFMDRAPGISGGTVEEHVRLAMLIKEFGHIVSDVVDYGSFNGLEEVEQFMIKARYVGTVEFLNQIPEFQKYGDAIDLAILALAQTEGYIVFTADWGKDCGTGEALNSSSCDYHVFHMKGMRP